MLTKIHIVKAMFLFSFSSSHVQMWELNDKEDWALNNWFFWIVVLKKALDWPFYIKEIKPVNPKGNQWRIFIGRTGAEFEVPILWPPDLMSQLTEKNPDAGKDWGQEKGVAHEMVGWHHWFNVYELEQIQETMKDREAWQVAVHGVSKTQTLVSKWKTTKTCKFFYFAVLKILCLEVW